MMTQKNFILAVIYVSLSASEIIALSQPVQNQSEANRAYNEKQTKIATAFSNPIYAKEQLNMISKLINKYRILKNGNWPEKFSHVQWVIMKESGVTSRESFIEAGRKFFNPDSKYTDDIAFQKNTASPYIILPRRPDGSLYARSRPASSRDALAFTELYYTSNYRLNDGANARLQFNPQGGYIVLWDNGEVDKVPYDQAFYTPSVDVANAFGIAFPTQAGVSGGKTISYEEMQSKLPRNGVIIGKPISGDSTKLIFDNGGPESLVTLSRSLNSSDRYGIDRVELWKQFDPAKPEFTLSDIQVGAAKLGLDTQVRKQPLSQLQKNRSPSLLFLKDDGRIVTLTALDDDRAVVVDRGLTRNVERSVLEKRYSGEALIPTKALTQNAGIVADDSVREVKLSSLEAEVPQSVTLRNTGKTPVTLQLEYPLLGVTESKLSKDTLAPGETATLDLKIKWRSILKAPMQNVLVSLQTSDPIVPRLQLAWLLVPPTAAK